MTAPTTKRALFVYFSYTQQAKRVAEAMAETLRADGYDVTNAAIELTDKRWVKNFAKFPMNNGFLDVLKMLPAQTRKATGEIKIPDSVTSGDYDLVIVGSPTWWLTTSIPIRSFLKSPEAMTLLSGTPFAGYVVCRRYWGYNLKTVKKLGTERGGKYLDGLHFSYQGGQIRSLMSLISYLGSGEYRAKYFGVKIPKTNLPAGFEREAKAFAHDLTTQLAATPAS
jgi:flavodoxin